MTPTGFDITSLPSTLKDVVSQVLGKFYVNIAPPSAPKTYKSSPKAQRNAEIIKRYQNGETLQDFAAAFGISPQRVQQIIKGK